MIKFGSTFFTFRECGVCHGLFYILAVIGRNYRSKSLEGNFLNFTILNNGVNLWMKIGKKCDLDKIFISSNTVPLPNIISFQISLQ